MKLSSLALSAIALGSVAGTWAAPNNDSDITNTPGLLEDILVPFSASENSDDAASSPEYLLDENVDAETSTPAPAEGAKGEKDDKEDAKGQPAAEEPKSIMDTPLSPACAPKIRDQFKLERVRTCFGLHHEKDTFTEASYKDHYQKTTAENMSPMHDYLDKFSSQYCELSAKCDTKELLSLRDMIETSECEGDLPNNGWLQIIYNYVKLYPLLQSSFCTEGPTNVFVPEETIGKCGGWTAKKIFTAAIGEKRPIEEAIKPIQSNLMELFLNPLQKGDDSLIAGFGKCDACVPIYGKKMKAYRNKSHKNKQFADYTGTFLEDSDKLSAAFTEHCPRVVTAFSNNGASLTPSLIGGSGLAMGTIALIAFVWV